MRSALRRVKCWLGFHRPIGGYRFIQPQHPRYRYEVACLWCGKVFS